MSVRELGELGLIRRIREGARGGPAAGVPVGIGDDAAVLAVTPGAALLVTRVGDHMAGGHMVASRALSRRWPYC